ncbi:hypothetical protein [Longimycelium tulufanense]|uniref:hypothetical protein n=1 Tax=Longimycelium tulufanense TaxID=907463 RepID=UPI001664E242|nr:hypothetical protein [Longimycelium tulufanense]
MTGLQRPRLQLFDDDTGHLIIDPDTGALHESDDGTLWLGPPKTPESARTISLPPFLVRLLRAHLATVRGSPLPGVRVIQGGWHRLYVRCLEG